MTFIIILYVALSIALVVALALRNVEISKSMQATENKLRASQASVRHMSKLVDRAIDEVHGMQLARDSELSLAAKPIQQYVDENHDGVVSSAAKVLGVSRQAVYKAFKRDAIVYRDKMYSANSKQGG